MTAEDREIARTAPAWWTGADVSQTELPPLPNPDQWGSLGHSDDQMQGYARTALAAERARADAAERDARRYRFLRSIGDEQLRVFGHYAGPALDAAIDATTEGVQHGEAK